MSDARTQLVGAGYDAMTETWEAWKAEITHDPRAEWLDELMRRLPEGARVVELGCGGGTRETAVLARRFQLTGVDLVEIALRQALGEEVPDELAHPRFTQPLAIRFLTAQPGPLPTGKVTRIGPLDPVLAAKGVVQADTYLQVGETIRPVRLDGDRRGYVIATADTSVEALARAERAALLLEVEVE